MSKKFKVEDYLREYEINFPIPVSDDFGKDVILKNCENKDVYCYYNLDKEGYREVELYISSFRGSFGAVHYYGKLKSNLSFCETPEQIGKTSISGRFTRGIDSKYEDFLNIDLVRHVDEKDLQHDEDYNRDRWLRYKIGDKTNGFWTEEEVIKLGTKVFKKLFIGKWKLYINSYSGKYDKYIYL
jgi:hypothetical protein